MNLSLDKILKKAYGFNNQTLRLDKLFSKDIALIKAWRNKFIDNMLDVSNNIICSHKFGENSISSHSLFKEKPEENNNKRSFFEKKQRISLEKNTEENEKFVISEEKNKKKKKAGKNLLKIIKSSEYHRKLFSERDTLSLIQEQLIYKEKIFNRTNSFEKNIIDLSIEDQRKKLNELLKKKLDIYQNKEKQKRWSPESRISMNFFKKIPVFNGNKTHTSVLANNINIRLKKTLEKAQKTHSNHEKKAENFDLNGCFTRFSFHQN